MHLKNTRKEEKNHEYADYYVVCGYGYLLHNPYACFLSPCLQLLLHIFCLQLRTNWARYLPLSLVTCLVNYTMLAAPLFIFMANVLNEGEVTDKLFSFCNGLLGRLKGGTAQVKRIYFPYFLRHDRFCYRRCFRHWSDGDRPDEKRGLRCRVQLCYHSRFRNCRDRFSRQVFRWLFTLCYLALPLVSCSWAVWFLAFYAILLMIYKLRLFHKRNYPAGVVSRVRESS